MSLCVTLKEGVDDVRDPCVRVVGFRRDVQRVQSLERRAKLFGVSPQVGCALVGVVLPVRIAACRREYDAWEGSYHRGGRGRGVACCHRGGRRRGRRVLLGFLDDRPDVRVDFPLTVARDELGPEQGKRCQPMLARRRWRRLPTLVRGLLLTCSTAFSFPPLSRNF